MRTYLYGCPKAQQPPLHWLQAGTAHDKLSPRKEVKEVYTQRRKYHQPKEQRRQMRRPYEAPAAL
ncbi:hypothetical protein [Mumia zhuanghuii]|uniref:hypothetical protein n=1 Tax=Mumia zhuanghuii TaxID=2585211 RepID=UPI001890FC3A|nr:hypothetical protein [Mumia zhuanghuii]